MKNYEVMFVLDTRPAKKDWEALEKDLHAVFQKHGGAVVRAARWGEKKMTFEIRRQKKGIYYLAYVQVPTDAIPALRREFQLHDSVLRMLFLAVETIPATISFYSEIDGDRPFGGGDYGAPRPEAGGGGPGAPPAPGGEPEGVDVLGTEAKGDQGVEGGTGR